MTRKLYPKCLESDAEMGNTSQGYLLPCCWWDVPDLFTSDLKDLVQEKFKLDTIQSIDEILLSPEWASFFKNIKEGIAPDYCYQICGKSGKMFGIKNEDIE